MRPAQGYPLRLINPGWEGNTNVKWLHSLKLTDQPYMARDETSKYSDLMPDGKARIFTYAMEAKSVMPRIRFHSMTFSSASVARMSGEFRLGTSRRSSNQPR